MTRRKLRRLMILRGAAYATAFWIVITILYGIADRIAG